MTGEHTSGVRGVRFVNVPARPMIMNLPAVNEMRALRPAVLADVPAPYFTVVPDIFDQLRRCHTPGTDEAGGMTANGGGLASCRRRDAARMDAPRRGDMLTRLTENACAWWWLLCHAVELREQRGAESRGWSGQ
jgi:hypothetical protein